MIPIPIGPLPTCIVPISVSVAVLLPEWLITGNPKLTGAMGVKGVTDDPKKIFGYENKFDSSVPAKLVERDVTDWPIFWDSEGWNNDARSGIIFWPSTGRNESRR